MKSTLPIRRLIPKWRPVGQTIASDEIAPITGKAVVTEADQAEFQRALHDWKLNPSAGHFGEVLAFSVFPECAEAIAKVAEDASKKNLELTPTQRVLSKLSVDSRSELEGNQNTTSAEKCHVNQTRLRALRRLLRINPANPFALLDFSQLQLAMGKRKAADRAIRSVLAMMPNNPMVIRTYSRYLVHIGDLSKAHSYLAKHPATRGNPWLVASEISVAATAGRSPVFYGAGRRMVSSDRFAPLHISELAGAIASGYREAGQHKAARPYYLAALRKPNDNVAAQLITDQSEIGISLEPVQVQRAISAASEASAISFAHRGDLAGAAMSAEKWLLEEPFSSRPANFLTALYTVDGKFDVANKIAHLGLTADPDDLNLNLSLAYLSALRGDSDGALTAARKALSLDRDFALPFIESTIGYMHMRGRDFESGDFLYREAMEKFIRRGDQKRAALCATYYARSARDTGHPKADEILQQAVDLVPKSPTPEALLLLSRLSESQIVDNPMEQRRSEQWIYHPATNTLERIEGITKVGVPAIIWSDN